jgi:VWFA-related protein
LQEIVRFAVERAGDATAGIAKTPDALPIEGEPAAVPDIAQRFVAYLFDDIHLSFEDLARAREAAGRQLGSLPKTDRAAIFTTSGHNQVDFTDDIGKLQADLLLLRDRPINTRNSGSLQCPKIGYYMADQMIDKNDPLAYEVAIAETIACLGLEGKSAGDAAEALARAAALQALSMGKQETRASLALLKETVRRMSAMPGQRIVVTISPGFFSPDEFQSDLNEIIDAAVKAKVVLNSLDPRGLWVGATVDASQSSLGGRSGANPALLFRMQRFDHFTAFVESGVLDDMANGTGGSLFHNNNDLDEGLRELAAAPEVYYVLGFAPQNLRLDASFHALKVSLKTNPQVSLNIQARKGYFAPRQASDAEENARAEIEEAIFSTEELSELPVELLTRYYKVSDTDAKVAVLCRIDPRHIQFRKADGRNLNILTVASALFDRNGNFVSAIEKTIDIKMKDATLAKQMATGAMTIRTDFSVQPGSYLIRLVVRDSEGQLMSAQTGAVAVQ